MKTKKQAKRKTNALNRLRIINPKQAEVADAILAGKGNIGKRMVEAGYSPAYAKNPQALIKTQSFQELLRQVIPPTLVANKHAELLNAEVKTSVKGMVTTKRMDSEAVSKGLDMYYKLNGSYAPDKLVQLNLYQGKDDSEILAEIDRLEQELRIDRNKPKEDESILNS